MKNELLLNIWFGAMAFCAVCWGVAGLGYAYDKWRGWNSDEDGGGGGDTPDNPFSIDPQRDPGDWWKHKT